MIRGAGSIVTPAVTACLDDMMPNSRSDRSDTADRPMDTADRPMEIVTADYSNPGHARAIVELLDAYSRDPMGSGRPLDESVRGKLVDGLRQHPASLVLLAYVADQPAGIAVCFRGYSTFAARPLLNVHDLAVLPDCRGHGVGRRLLQAVEAEARRLECCKVTLEVRDDNQPAQRLYQGLGFQHADGHAGGAAMLFWNKPLL